MELDLGLHSHAHIPCLPQYAEKAILIQAEVLALGKAFINP